jgi:transcriptional regulator with XRE-family HTH domain
VSKLFGDYIRSKRESKRREDPEYSIRKVASRIGIHHSYLSKIERGEPATLSEKRIVALAAELGDDPELLLAMNGKVSEAVRRAVFADPQRVVSLLNQIKDGVAGGD